MPFFLAFPYAIYLISSETTNQMDGWVKLMHRIASALANDSSGTSWQNQLTSDLTQWRRSNSNSQTPIYVGRRIS
jgi:hypothetical protein